jgi:hypothetical protein
MQQKNVTLQNYCFHWLQWVKVDIHHVHDLVFNFRILLKMGFNALNYEVALSGKLAYLLKGSWGG